MGKNGGVEKKLRNTVKNSENHQFFVYCELILDGEQQEHGAGLIPTERSLVEQSTLLVHTT